MPLLFHLDFTIMFPSPRPNGRRSEPKRRLSVNAFVPKRSRSARRRSVSVRQNERRPS